MTRSVSVLDAAIGVALSAFGVFLVSGGSAHAGAAAAVLVLLMTLPVVWRRRAPLAVAAVLAAGAVLNPALIGDMTRCGPALPALLLCAYAVGRKPDALGRLAASLAVGCLLLSAAVQTATDPALDSSVIVAMTPMILALYGVGRLVRSRTRLAADLEERNEQLRQQRERRAELAVQADRSRIADGLEASLNARITEIGAAAESGRRVLADDESSEAVQEAFGVIQRRGRDTLAHMRRMVGTMLEPGPTEPQPSLSQLDRLLERAGPADIHLHVTGQPRLLPTGVELSIYRTLEHLLDAYGGVQGARVDVEVDFTSDALALTVRGPAPDRAGLRAALAGAQTRVDLHHGSLSSDCLAGRWEAIARVPV